MRAVLIRKAIVVAMSGLVAGAVMMDGVCLGAEEPAEQATDSQAGTPPVQRDPNRLWCREHGVYEDECFICHPELKEPARQGPQGEAEPAGGAEAGKTRLWCAEHDVAEIECGICQPQLAGGLAPGQSMKVRLPSRESARKAGIRAATPSRTPLTPGFRVFCESHYNQNRQARITPLASGVIYRVHADIGERVTLGQLLVEIASAEVAAAKRDFLLAIVDERLKRLAYEREKQLAEKEISAIQSFQQAEAEYEMARIGTLSARQKLLNHGFTDDEVDEVAKTRSSDSIVHVHAPFAGVLVERSAVVGEAVQPGSPLFTLADLSTMWLTLSIPESKVGLADVGLPVEATFAALPGTVATGRITWIDSSVTEPSRMVQARAEVTNPDGLLRNNMFGEARIVVGAESSSLTLPAAAVQQFEQRPFVFVRLDEDLFELRRIVVGSADQDRVQVLRGIDPEDPIVVAGSYTMLSEFLKSRLGAGCVED